jgi:modulator of FtsH protease
MSLYDRNYEDSNVSYGTRDDSAIVSYVKQTYQLFAASMLAAAVGSYVGMPFAAAIAANYWFIVIPWILFAWFGFPIVKHKAGINMVALFAWTFASGVIITPLLTHVLSMSGGASIVANAFLMTAVTFGGLSLFAMKSAKDYTPFGKPLIIAVIVVIVFSLVNMFIFQSPIFHVLLSGGVFLIFSFLTVVDTQNIIQGNFETPMDGAIQLYLDFLNMFTALLQIFGFMNSDD